MSTIAASTTVEFHIARRGQSPEPVFDRETAATRATGVWVDVPAGTQEAEVVAFVAQKVAQLKRDVLQPDPENPKNVAAQLPTTPYTKPGFVRWSVRLTRPTRFTL